MQKEQLTLAVCTKPVTYVKRVYTAIFDHMKTKRHVCAVIAKLMSSLLLGTDKSGAEHSGLYGIAPVYHESKTAPKPAEAYLLKNVVHYI